MTDETPTAKRRHMTDREIAQGMALLTEHLRRAGDGFAYAAGWSDQLVATELGCTLANAAGLRERNFGKLTKAVEVLTDARVDELIRKHNAFVHFVIEGDADSKDPSPFLLGETK